MLDLAEHPPPARSRDRSFYAVLLLAVLPLWASIPVAWVYAARLLYYRSWSDSPSKRILCFIACCEVLFSIYHYILARRVAGPAPYGPGDPQEIQTAFVRLLKSGLADLPKDGGDIETLMVDRPGSPAETITQLERHDPRAVDFRHSLRTWFMKVPFSSITLREVHQWLYWAMYNADLPCPEEVPEVHRGALDEAMALLEKRMGCKIEHKESVGATPMRLTIDRTNILWRPLSFYALVSFVNWCLKRLYTHKWGVQYGSSNGIEYLLRNCNHWDPVTSPRPLVFIHGLGLGLLQYHTLIAQLVADYTDRPILILLQPQISQNFFHPQFLKPYSRHQMAEKLATLLSELGWADLGPMEALDEATEEEKAVERSLVDIPDSQRGVTIVSHSNGSYMHAWMLKNYSEIVGRSCFVDPVTFCSWEGDVCYNFFYRPCMTGMELLMRYFVGTELGVSNLLQRHFCWTSNSLWFEEIPNARDPAKTLFLLGGKDDIVHSERVKTYLTSHGISKNLWYDPDGKHGQALMPGSPGINAVLEWLSQEADETAASKQDEKNAMIP